jgi:hypothetical protein
MTKKIEISPNLSNVGSNLWHFTNNNSTNGNGSCKMYLMYGPRPFNNNGLVPTSYNATIPTIVDEYNIGIEQPNVPSGTYLGTSTFWGRGLEVTFAVTVDNNEVTNLQVINSSGYLKDDGSGYWGEIILAERGLNVIWDPSSPVTNPSIDITFSLSSNQNILVQWNNNRIKTNGSDSLTAFAAMATKNGEATWFFGYNQSNQLAFVGTVGLTGSGADLELDDVNIVQGKTYGISNLRFQMPTSFTY